MKLYGLIGYPLGHSFSKEYFTDKFKRENLSDCVFEAFPIPSIAEFNDIVKDNPSLKGMGVTIPYKEQVLSFVDEQSEEVKAIGATNSIRIYQNKRIAYNTDIIGFEKSFCKYLKPIHKKALVLGTGGASKAVQYVLKKLQINYLVVTRDKTAIANSISYKDLDQQILNNYQVIINCTPVGMYPNENIAPEIPYEFLTSAHYLYDLVYKPKKTLFLERGEAAGATTENGYEMLLIQAEESWKIWNME